MSSERTGSCPRPGSSVFRLTALLFERPATALGTAAVAISVGVLNWGSAFLIQRVVDGAADRVRLQILAAGLVAACAARAVLSVLRRYLQLTLSQQVERALIGRLLDAALNMRPEHARRHTPADLQQRMDHLEHVRFALEDRLLGVFLDAVLVVASAILLASRSLSLAGLACLGAVVPAVAVYFLKGSIKESFRRVQELKSQNAEDRLDAFDGLMDLRLCGGEEWIRGRVVAGSERHHSARIRHQVKLAIIGTSTGLVSTLFGIGLLYCGSLQVAAGVLSPGQVMFAYTVAGTMLGPLENVVVSWLFFDDAAAALDRADELGAGEGLERRAPGAPRPFRGEVRLENVGFSYGPGRHVLRRVDATIPAGASLAVVGESGAGKSSLIGLVMGLLTPSEGRILVDGRDLREVPFREWRSRIGAVLQKPHSFRGSIAENVSLGADSWSGQSVREALAAAGLGEFVRALPEGIHSTVASRGRNLSGGEGQRLALARALVRNPGILVLDEATSNLDADAEAAVWNRLFSSTSERTLIFVTHRLPISALADRILVLHAGLAVESGSFRELMALRGYYFRLWNRQTGMEAGKP